MVLIWSSSPGADTAVPNPTEADAESVVEGAETHVEGAETVNDDDAPPTQEA